MSEWIRVGSKKELPSGRLKTAEVRGRQIVIYNVEGKLYSTDNTCAHQGGPLGLGLLEGTVVTCPWHAWQFDICSGKSIFDPDVEVATFPVKVEGDDILVEV
ncbi:MAG TPA: Rieske (2Fe-2S) protein [Vicinamibacteria bacterium]|nr:Rieske (2Fe-2S) protein [Vicinamibacteria bacterium]